MRKLISCGLIILLMLMSLTKVTYAKPNCTVSIVPDKSEVVSKDTVTFDVSLSKIQSENGIIAIQAILEYDKRVLTLDDMNGQNKWSSPRSILQP